MKSESPQGPVKFLIFKDGEISRSIEVSERWLMRAGLLLLSLCAITVASGAVALRFYLEARPTFVPSDSVLARATPSPVPVVVPVSTPVAVINPAPSPTSRPSPSASASVSIVAQAPPAASPSAAVATLPAPDLEALATFISRVPVSPQSIEETRLDVMSLSATRAGRSLNVRFNIQSLSNESPGARQGRFVVVAYGKSGIIAYPTAALNGTSLELQRGETYSVARFRSVAVPLGPLRAPGSAELRVEVLLLDHDLNLIVRKSITIGEVPNPTNAGVVTGGGQ